MAYRVEMFAAVVDADVNDQPDDTEIEAVAWVQDGRIQDYPLGEDMAEIVPAAFAWFSARSRTR